MIIRDGAWTLYDYDPASGRSVWHLHDGEKDVFRIDYPVTGLVAANGEARAEAGRAWKGDWHRVASIPLNIAHDRGLVRAQSEGDFAYVRRFLNDSDNRDWRTREGRL